jgi:O-antigen ligase
MDANQESLCVNLEAHHHPAPDLAFSRRSQERPTDALAFGVFILLNATLFIRPAEVVPALLGLPIYQALTILCLALCFSRMIERLSVHRLQAAPLTACVFGLWWAVILSRASHFALADAVAAGAEFGKAIIYYLMLVTLVDSARRMQVLLLCLTVFTLVLAGLALLHYHGYISISGIEEARDSWTQGSSDGSQSVEIVRLSAIGIFGSPNDLAKIVVVGMLLAAHWIIVERSITSRILWIPAFLGLGYALNLTQSRGGFLSLMVGMAVFLRARFGLRRFLFAAFAIAPALIWTFSGRQLDIDTSTGTGQQRIQIWAEGLALMRGSPIFGIGIQQYVENVGLVAHNSFVHCFVELGLFGGTLFTGAFYLALWQPYLVGRQTNVLDEQQRRLAELRPCMLGIVAGVVVGMLSSTRSYDLPTYMVLGLVASYLQLMSGDGVASLRLSRQLITRLCVVSLCTLVVIHFYIRLFAIWN